MNKPLFEIVTLKSGVNSIRDLESGEVLHPAIGPMAEAKRLHVEQQCIRERASLPGKFVIWDVGLGGAANAIAALEALQECEAEVELHSFDIVKSPMEFAVKEAESLHYPLPWCSALESLLELGQVKIHKNLSWHFHLGDFKETMFKAPFADAVFYDPYSSVSNQELWTLDHLKVMKGLLNPRATITNYSASSAVRVTWLLAGYFVGVGVGVGKKLETFYASNEAGVVPSPLAEDWFKKLSRSQSSAPIRLREHIPATIQADDLASLSIHPQFASL